MCVKPGKLSGATLVELVVFIVIVSVAVVGILQVMNFVTGHSADALVQKQAQAIAESMLEEIELQHFTASATCTGTLGLNAARTSAAKVCDYNGYSTNNGILDFTSNTVIGGLNAYNLNVAVANTAFAGIPAASAVLITVTVNGPSNFTAVAQGYRTSE